MPKKASSRKFYCLKKREVVSLKSQNQWDTEIEYLGKNYDFTHLKPISIAVNKPEKPGLYPALNFELVVIFDCHVTTETFSNQNPSQLNDSDLFWLDKGEHLRVFCPLRYEKSKFVSTLVNEAANGKRHVYLTNGDNAMVCEIEGGGSKKYYVIYFDLQMISKSANDNPKKFRMYVQSAYIKEFKPNRGSQVYVAAMCAESIAKLESKFRKN
ncbi:hypothetical protein [Limnobacter profundi]|uniref:Uncharacterized protein n=1 Tax=Limnobacter profundi TaxID=2732163 RepID=A0ABX6N1V8_9BURK|nr:hypothetical protein [Limnobacter sp. SAORIC-580]QJR28218.1 hypothetical protein HKT17_00105 [Limnobacter sp. SAORIC-580]